MSDSLSITVQALLASADVTDIFGDRIAPIFVPQQWQYPNAAVHLIHEFDRKLLCGPANWPNSRVSIELRTAGDVPRLLAGAAAVIKALNGKDFAIIGYSGVFWKEGTDVTDHAEITSTESYPSVVRRIIDFRLDWQQLCDAASSGGS